jgi:hypothetical protein
MAGNDVLSLVWLFKYLTFATSLSIIFYDTGGERHTNNSQ